VRSHAPSAILDRPNGQGDRCGQRTWTGGAGRRLSSWERGQARVEYVALVALVALYHVGVIAAMKSTQSRATLLPDLKKITERVGKSALPRPTGAWAQ